MKQTFYKSTRKNKKYMTNYKGKIIHFGDLNSEHYFDKLGLYKNLNHNDKKRQMNYLNRSAGIKTKGGTLTKDDPFSANFYSRRFLWGSKGTPLGIKAVLI